MVPPTGLEPVTNRLLVDCSTGLGYGGGMSFCEIIGKYRVKVYPRHLVCV